MSVNVTQGTGSASVAAEVIATQQYQLIKVVDGTAASTNKWVINSDGSAQVSVLGGLQVTGSVLANIGGSVVAVNQGSVGAVIIGGSILSVPTGSVIAVQQGSVGAVVIGGSVIAQVIGSVVSLNTGSIITTNVGSVITVWKDSSVLAIPGNTSQISIWPAPSIVGTYAEDTAHVVDSRGLFTLAIRNDTMASVTSATGDYSQYAVGPSGETVTANAPLTSWVRGTADLRGPVTVHSVTVIAAQGASVFTYVTGVQVVNFGPSSVIVTFSGATSSIVGYTIAPAGGGSNIYYPNALKTNQNAAFAASISGTASVLVSAQGFTARI